jgi:hypothetical protein
MAGGACNASLSIRQHTSANVSIHVYVSIRQHTSAYVRRPKHGMGGVPATRSGIASQASLIQSSLLLLSERRSLTHKSTTPERERGREGERERERGDRREREGEKEKEGTRVREREREPSFRYKIVRESDRERAREKEREKEREREREREKGPLTFPRSSSYFSPHSIPIPCPASCWCPPPRIYN